MANPIVFFDMTADDAPMGLIVIELYSDVVPRTAENFRALCTGEMGADLTFKGSVFHRVIPGIALQGGDITNGDGTGGKSIFGPNFADENFNLQHTAPGIVSMFNAGPGTNGSQFLINLDANSTLDRKNVVFGKVTTGMAVVKAIESLGSARGKPSKKIVIANCGQLAALA